METKHSLESNFPSFIPFPSADLKANKQGQLTERQMELIQSHLPEEKVLKEGALAMIYFWLGINLLFALFSSSYREDVFHLSWLWALLLAPLFIWALSYPINKILYKRVANQKKTFSVTGKAHKKSWRGGPWGIAYSIFIDGVRFETSKEVFDLIKEGQNYTFYYIKNVGYKMPVSWEESSAKSSS